MPSFTLKELPETNSGICYCDDDCSDPSNILCEIPTRKFSEPNTTTVVDLLNDDDNNILIANAQKDMTPAPTFLQEWEAFYLDFKKSTTYALAHSSTASLLPSLVDDDNADDDRTIHECDIDKLPTNSSAGLRQLRHSIRELEKVNIQFASFVEFNYTPAPCQPTLCTIDNNLPHPQPCLELQRDDPPQYAPMMAPPPAPNPACSFQNPTQQPSQTDRCPSSTIGTMFLVEHPAPKLIPCDLS